MSSSKVNEKTKTKKPSIVEKKAIVADKKKDEVIPIKASEVVLSPVNSEDEGDDNDMFQIFDIMHSSIEGLKEKFTTFYDEPSKTNFAEFDDLIVDFIALARDLKNMTKSLIPASEKEKKPDEKRGRKKKANAKQDIVINPTN